MGLGALLQLGVGVGAEVGVGTGLRVGLGLGMHSCGSWAGYYSPHPHPNPNPDPNPNPNPSTSPNPGGGWLLLPLTLTPTPTLTLTRTRIPTRTPTQVGWLLLSLTDPMAPPGPVLEAVLSKGGEVAPISPYISRVAPLDLPCSSLRSPLYLPRAPYWRPCSARAVRSPG